MVVEKNVCFVRYSKQDGQHVDAIILDLIIIQTCYVPSDFCDKKQNITNIAANWDLFHVC